VIDPSRPDVNLIQLPQRAPVLEIGGRASGIACELPGVDESVQWRPSSLRQPLPIDGQLSMSASSTSNL
jgi:hypothetical protein